LAVGAKLNGGTGFYGGHVRVFQNNGGTWQQVGEDVNAEAAYDLFGISVAINDDGTVLAVGATKNADGGSWSGHVRVYRNEAGTWQQVGEDINGEAINDQSGSQISMNSDGSIIAIASHVNNGAADFAGHVRVFQNQTNSWVQIGNDIDGEFQDDYFGKSVSLNGAGNIVAIGATGNDANGDAAGNVRVFQNNAGNWVQLANSINGEGGGNQFGSSICISADGETLISGAQFSSGGGSQRGSARVFNLQLPPEITSQPETLNNICPTSNISFSVIATGADSYQWQTKSPVGAWQDIQTQNSFINFDENTLTSVLERLHLFNGFSFRCVVSNGAGESISEEAVLNFETESPAFTSTHDDVLINSGTDCTVPLADYTSAVTATDNCTSEDGITISQNPAAGTQISGENEISLTISDVSGNENTITFAVDIEESIAPIISCIENQVITLNEGETYYTVSGNEFDPLSTQDNCNSFSVENDNNFSASLNGEEFALGITAVNWIITDDSGNSSDCSFTVEINTFVGTDNLKQNKLTLYPNPVHDFLYLNSQSTEVQNVLITDISGKVVVETIILNREKAINLSLLEKGVYFVKINTQNGISVQKIIKK